MERMHAAVRRNDPTTMTLFAPAEVNNRLMRHVGYESGFLPGEPMAFHIYCVTGTDGPGPTSPWTKGLCHFNDHFEVGHRAEVRYYPFPETATAPDSRPVRRQSLTHMLL